MAVTLDTVLEQARQLPPDERMKLLTILEQERRAVRLEQVLDEWLDDDSGYDEAVWPELEEALEQTRADLGMRKLFDE